MVGASALERRPAMDPDAVRVRLREARRARQLSAQQVADRAADLGMPSLTRSTIAKIESGVRKVVTLEEVVTLSRVLKVPLERLIGTGAEQGGSGSDVIASRLGSVDIHAPVSFAGRLPEEWPRRIGVVPPVAASYLPRTDPAVELERVLAEQGSTVVVSGMGGVGKTQLAAAYAHRLWEVGGVDLLVWLTATSRDAILAGYAQASADVAHPPEGEHVEQVAQRFLAWLAATDKRCLVVLDDLADPNDLKGLWPQGRTGRVLVTTRRRDAALGDRGTVVDVDLFTSDEALAYLTRRLDPDGRHPGRLAEAGELAEDLGRLPLALAQAAAFMRDRDLTCAAYRRRLARRRLESALPADAAADDYTAIVASTWWLSVELADRLPPDGLARPLLTLAALLNPNGIPLALFTTDAVRAYLATPEQERPPELVAEDAEEVLAEDVEDALSNLHRLSLLTLAHNEDGVGTVRVHALVQRATREQAPAPELDAAARTVAQALLEAWPEQDYQPQHALLAQSLRDNTDALAATAPGVLLTPHGQQVLFHAGRSRSAGGLVAQAVTYWTTLTDTAEQTLGVDHPTSLAARGNLAVAYRAAGRPAEALPLLERTVADCKRIIGPDHPETLSSRNLLALVYQDIGLVAEAVELFERTVADCERLLGPDHPGTVTSRSNLAYAYRNAGRLAEALPLFERTVADCERVFGLDDPNTLAARNNLAAGYLDAGRLAQAVALFERSLADRERVLGAQHPDTLTSRTHLAGAYRAAGRLAEAVALLERVVADSEPVLGVGHPELAARLHLLSQAQAELGNLASAAAALGRAVEVDTAAYGPDHPKVATVLDALAALLERQGATSGVTATRARAQRIREQQQEAGSATQRPTDP